MLLKRERVLVRLTSLEHSNSSLYLRTHVDIENGITVTSPELFGLQKLNMKHSTSLTR
jgi:hypothetical protein